MYLILPVVVKIKYSEALPTVLWNKHIQCHLNTSRLQFLDLPWQQTWLHLPSYNGYWMLPDQQPLTPFQQFNYRKHQLQVHFFNAQDSLFTAWPLLSSFILSPSARCCSHPSPKGGHRETASYKTTHQTAQLNSCPFLKEGNPFPTPSPPSSKYKAFHIA